MKIIIAALLLSAAQSSFAAPTITVSSAGNGVFTVQGTGMDGVAAMDIALQYDTTTLANPRTEQGSLISGAMMAENPNTPGVVRIAIIRTTPITGNGPILAITFDRKNSSPGVITGLNVTVSDINGRPLPASREIVNPMETTSVGTDASAQQQISPQQPKTPPQALQTTTAPALIFYGVVMKPNEETTPKQEEPVVAPVEQPEPAQAPDVSETGSEVQKSEADLVVPTNKSPTVYTRKTVLEVFRDYKGVRLPKVLIALFEQEPMIGFRQDPLVALSDGKSTVMVRFISTSERKGISDLILAGAKLLSAKKDPQATNTWIVTLLPKADVTAVSLSVPQGDLLMVFPLVVAPKVKADLDGSKSVTEADFTLFLKDRGTPKSPRHDLNGDGARDYKDEYIFTANYQAARGK